MPCCHHEDHWTTLAAAADAADEILLDVFGLRSTRKDDRSLLTRRGFESVLREMTRELLRVSSQADQAALREVLHALDVNWRGMSPTDVDAALERAARALQGVPRVVVPPVIESLSRMGRQVVSQTKEAFHDLPIAGAFDVVDERVIKHAAQSHALYVRDEYGRRAVAASARAREVVSAGIREGLDRNDIGARLGAEMTAMSVTRSQSYWSMVSSVFAGRARTWGALSSFTEAGIEEYEISEAMDGVTCSACRLMHGKVFSTSAAVDRYVKVADSGDPESVIEMQPFLGVAVDEEGREAIYYKQGGQRRAVAQVLESGVGRDNDTGKYGSVLGRGGMEAAGISAPPFHPHCRGVVVGRF